MMATANKKAPVGETKKVVTDVGTNSGVENLTPPGSPPEFQPGSPSGNEDTSQPPPPLEKEKESGGSSDNKPQKSYKAKTPIEHDGKTYGVGDSISFDDVTHAKSLLSLGAIEEDAGE